MPLLGAHVSIAGGVDKAPERGRRATCDVIQIFTKSTVRWACRPITAHQSREFAASVRRYGIQLAFAHACYLINLCSPDAGVRRRSRRGLLTELRRAAKLDLPYLVVHPGSHAGLTFREAVRAIVEATAWAAENMAPSQPGGQPLVLFETTAGQGSSFGWRFEHLAELLTRLEGRAPVGVCFDTCHVFAAGYDLRTPEAYAKTMDEFDRTVGLDRIKVVHLNDSLGALGSRRDRHQHIGRGEIGLEGFRAILNDPRLAHLPMVIETPKWRSARADIANLKILRDLVEAGRGL